MTATAFVRARIDESLKNEAAAVLVCMGLTVSDVVHIALTKVAREKTLPFEMHLPNTLTAVTLEKSERGKDTAKLKTLLSLLIKGKPLYASYLTTR